MTSTAERARNPAQQQLLMPKATTSLCGDNKHSPGKHCCFANSTFSLPMLTCSMSTTTFPWQYIAVFLGV